MRSFGCSTANISFMTSASFLGLINDRVVPTAGQNRKNDEGLVYNFIMSNFYTEEDVPLRRVRVVTHSRDLMITAPPKRQKLNPPRGVSPLWAVTKLILGELERPMNLRKETV